MTVLVTGARGRVGRAVLDALLAAGAPADRLRASGRDPSALDLPPGVGAVAADLDDPATLGPALEGVEQVFVYSLPEAMAGFVDAARAAGVAHVVLLSSMAVLEGPEDEIGARHRAAEAPLVDSGIPATLLRPGAFAANAFRWAPGIVADGTVTLPYPESHTTPIHERDIADVAASALLDPDSPARGTAVTLTGPASLTGREQVAILSDVLGRPLAVREVGADEFRAQMRGAPPGIADTLLSLWAAADGIPQPVEDVARLTGRPGRTFAAWAHDHRAAFGGAHRRSPGA